MDFLIRFCGHIDETRRPEGFPAAVYADVFARVGSDKDLRSIINDQCTVFIKQQCMIVPKDPGGLENLKYTTFDSRVLVPLHMITHLTTETKKITGEIPDLDEDGTLQLLDGTKPSIQ